MTTVNEKAFFFQKRSPEWRFFENAGVAFARGRRTTEVFEYNDVVHHILLVLHMLCEKFLNRSRAIFYDVIDFSPVNVFLSFFCGDAKAFQICQV